MTGEFADDCVTDCDEHDDLASYSYWKLNKARIARIRLPQSCIEYLGVWLANALERGYLLRTLRSSARHLERRCR